MPWPDGTPSWIDLSVPDLDLARRFYGPALDWQFHDISEGDFRYATFLAADGREVGGLGQPPTQLPSLAGRWLVYFAATDTDDVLDRAVRLGAEVVLPARTTPHGRLAVLRDDQQAVFALLGTRLNAQSRPTAGVPIAQRSPRAASSASCSSPLDAAALPW